MERHSPQLSECRDGAAERCSKQCADKHLRAQRGATSRSLYLAFLTLPPQTCAKPRQNTTDASSPIERNRRYRRASSAPQTSPMNRLSRAPTRRKLSGRIMGETRDACHSASVRRADRMCFGSPSNGRQIAKSTRSLRFRLVDHALVEELRRGHLLRHRGVDRCEFWRSHADRGPFSLPRSEQESIPSYVLRVPS